MPLRPGGEIAKRPLHVIWILDCSNSMNAGSKIQALNSAIREATPALQEAAKTNFAAQVLVRAVGFSTGAAWHIATPTPVSEFRWEDLTAQGETHLGRALSLVAQELHTPPMDHRALPPVLVLVSDGLPTDDWMSGLNGLMAEEWGRLAVRLAVAIGQDADLHVLERFIGNNEVPVLQANDAATLARYFIWVSRSIGKAFQTPAPSSERRSTQWCAGRNYNLQHEITDRNGNVETVVTAGTSGATEPFWPPASGAETTDGAVTWRNKGPADVW